jgi:hypothetical protein
MLNLALNFLEVSIINMFARKDNVDLSHVSKISKSMADLQATMQDLIDEGVDSTTSSQAPINQGQLQQPQQGQQPAPQVAPQSYSPAGGVGQLMTRNESFVLPPEMQQNVGGGAVAGNKSNRLVVWSHSGEQINSRVATASTKNNLSVGKAIENLAKALGVTANNHVASRVAESNQPIKTNSPTKAFGGKSMSIWEKFAQQRRLKQAAKATEKLELEDKAGNKVVISSKGDVEAYHKNQKVAWEPNITDSHLEAIASGNGIEVVAELLGEFGKAVNAAKLNGRTVISNWQPATPENVAEVELDPLRAGTYDDVIENLLGSESAERYKRTNPSGEESLSEAVAEVGGDVLADRMQTRQELLELAGLYGRRVSDDDLGQVKEALLEDARMGNPEDVLENQLAMVHKEHSSGAPNLVVKAAIEALAKSVVSSRVTPEEILEITAKLASRKDFAHLIKLAQLGAKRREVIASRQNFHNKEIILNPVSAIFNELGRVASAEATPNDLKEVLCTVNQNFENVNKIVTSSAQDIIKANNVAPYTKSVKASRADLLKAAVASHAANTENVNRDHLKTALMAFAAASEDALVTPTEIVENISGLETNELAARIEFARNEKAVNQRISQRARKEFFGSSRFASTNDIAENTIGWIADYAIEFDQPSMAIAEAVNLALDNPKVAANLVAKLIKTARISVTDEQISTLRINATVEELGLDPKSPDFKDMFREKAMQMLSDQGYNVDPNTFNLNEVSVSADGFVNATVSSRFSKTFDVESSPKMLEEAPIDETMEPEAENLGPIGQPLEEQGLVETDAAKQMKFSKRKQILERLAQMAPGMPAMPAMQPMNTPGVATMSGTPDDTMPEPIDTDTDTMPEPGNKMPVGSICPACGSKNVDLADGKGNCNDCNTNFEVTFQIIIKPDASMESKEETETPEVEEGQPLAGEVGLGAATAPAPEAPMAPAAPPATPGLGAPAAPGMPAMASTAPVMVRLSWKQDPEVFIKAASSDFDPDAETVLPVGHICPSCGNRHAKKVKNTRFCYSCGEVYIPRVHKSTDRNKVEVSIDKIV